MEDYGAAVRRFHQNGVEAIVVALPMNYYVTKTRLAGFAYKIDLEWWYFVGAGLLTILIALLTVSFRSVKAALMNPVESLRSE